MLDDTGGCVCAVVVKNAVFLGFMLQMNSINP